jgi:hypothetical protein
VITALSRELERKLSVQKPVSLATIRRTIGQLGLGEVFRESTRRWCISRRVAIVLFATPLLMLVAAAILHFAHDSMLRTVMQENGVVEWLQVVGFAVGMAASAMIAQHFFRQSQSLSALAYSILAVGLFFIAGEELAWGQWFLGVDTPRQLAAINVKSELSVHNISAVEPWFNAAKLMIGVYGTIDCFLLLRIDRRMAATNVDMLCVPAFLSSAFFVVVVLRLLRMTVLNQQGIANFGEYEELCIAYGLSMFAMLGYRRIRLERSRVSSSADRQCVFVPLDQVRSGTLD